MSAGFPNKNCNADFSFYTTSSQLMHSLWWISNPLVSSNSGLVLLNSCTEIFHFAAALNQQ
jgi:hypothetical protein